MGRRYEGLHRRLRVPVRHDDHRTPRKGSASASAQAHRRVLVTGTRGALGREVVALLGERAVSFDRVDGQELIDRAALRSAIAGCDGVIHLAALHPLIAPPDADTRTYQDANVAPFERLVAACQKRGVRKIVFASSTSVWRDSPAEEPARFIDETSPTDAIDAYAWSKIACEALLAATGMPRVILRLARFTRANDPEDDVRKLYRAVDVRDAAAAVVASLDLAGPRAIYAIAAPTPFTQADAALLGRDARAAIRARTGREPPWVPPRIGSVIVATRAARELGWRCAYPSTLLRAN